MEQSTTYKSALPLVSFKRLTGELGSQTTKKLLGSVVSMMEMTNAMVELRNNVAILEVLEEDVATAKKSYQKSRSNKRKAIYDDAGMKSWTSITV